MALKVKCTMPQGKFVFYDGMTYGKDELFTLLDEKDFNGNVMEWVEKPAPKLEPIKSESKSK